MNILIRHAGYWSVVVASAELLILTAQLWRLTGWIFFERWLRRLGWVLPLYLYIAYRVRGPLPRVLHYHGFEELLLFQARSLARDTDILAAIHIPYLAVGIAFLGLSPIVARRAKMYASAILRGLREPVDTAACRGKRGQRLRP